MAMTSVNVPEELLADAIRVLGAKTKREAITTALEDVVRRAAQRQALHDLTEMAFLQNALKPQVRTQARR